MRDDMAKVVTERPRRGHGNKSKKTTGIPIRKYDPDADYDEPVRLPVSRGRQYGWNAKEFSDLINPLSATSVPASAGRGTKSTANCRRDSIGGASADRTSGIT